LIDIQHSGEQVTAILLTKLVTADLLIGADGPNSTVRSCRMPVVYAGYVAYRVG